MRRTLLSVFALTAFAAAACGYADPYAGNPPIANESPGPASSPSVSPGADDFNVCKNAPAITYPDGLKVADLVVGKAEVAVKGQNATMQYTGWLSNGKEFDTSRQPGRTPFTFQIGSGQVIGGWDEGVPGMKVGGKRCLTIPPALGYGTSGQTNPSTGAVIIPPNATLIFAIELSSLAPGPSPSPSPRPSPSPSPSK